MSVRADRLVSALGFIGWSGPETLYLPLDVINNGWQPLIDNIVAPQIAWGCKHFLLHNPFGYQESDGAYSVDQAIRCRRMFPKVCQTFKAWRQVTSIPGVTVTTYLGTFHGDKDFAVRRKPTRIDDYLRRFVDSVNEILDAGSGVGWDWSGDWPEDSPEYAMINLLDRLGVETWLEARPAKDMSHLSRFNVISTNEFWDRSNPDKYEDAAQIYMPTSQIQGKIMRWQQTPVPPPAVWGTPGWMVPVAEAIQAEGHYAALAADWMMNEGVVLE